MDALWRSEGRQTELEETQRRAASDGDRGAPDGVQKRAAGGRWTTGLDEEGSEETIRALGLKLSAMGLVLTTVDALHADRFCETLKAHLDAEYRDMLAEGPEDPVLYALSLIHI